ncbi:MAG TPA: COR domain-containing protein, partial [Blastocatellia bacterium]|nr:COR domain-containing protein [Blastocatellia bacterium]
MSYKDALRLIEEAANNGSVSLDLSGQDLNQIPSSVFYLINLQELHLSNNKLTELPSEIGNLSNLLYLYLDINQLTTLPSEIVHLDNLYLLYLDDNPMSVIPPEVFNLTSLHTFSFGGDELIAFPPEIDKLINLRGLLVLGAKFTPFPPEVFKLVHLDSLYLSGNELTALPREIGNLVNLRILYLGNNKLNALPSEVGNLINLQDLYLNNNKLTALPPEMGNLRSIKRLHLDNNQLTALPTELSKLADLETLSLRYNKLRTIPIPFWRFNKLKNLRVSGNEITSPPPEIIEQGTGSILSFLRELEEDSITRYEAKLILVGEGGTGKSQLLRALRGEAFDPTVPMTHGIELGTYKVQHPDLEGVEIALNTWDFGGQQIYHATHQFFLTHRSVYVVVWNARLGPDQGNLPHWLDTIKALAPDARVILVATHIDEHAADLNYPLYQEAYPQLVGSYAVSNSTRKGIAGLKSAIAELATELPIMGQLWPNKWLAAERALEARPEHHLSLSEYVESFEEAGVDEMIAKGTLGAYLNDLGKILYFRDDYVLSNMIVLKPNWVTKAISRVLTDKVTREASGILTHSELPRIWASDTAGNRYEPYLYPVFLRLMERFDLSYQIEPEVPGDHTTHSLVPQLLPHKPPIKLPPWPEAPPNGEVQVEMIYKLDFVPAGIMSWFIVRSHPYSKTLQWREGVLLEYESHEARVEINPMLRELRILVSGLRPYNFFTILKNTADLILGRFEGLKIERNVPCICHWDRGETRRCPRSYRYSDLVRRMEAGRHLVECEDSYAQVSVPKLLYGIHISTDEQIILEIRESQKQIQSKLGGIEQLDQILEILSQQSELIVRNFTRLWNFEMR